MTIPILALLMTTVLYLVVGLGWVILLEKLSDVPFEPPEVIVVIALWPLVGPFALIVLALVYIGQRWNLWS